MATLTEVLPRTLPTKRDRPLDPPPELLALQQREPVSRMQYADGHVGWLVTGYDEARTVLADPRFSARRELHHPPLDGPVQESREPAEPGLFIRMDPPEQTRYRAPLARHFTTRKVRNLEPWIERVTGDLLDEMAGLEPPVDFFEQVAMPLPSLVICELLGIRYDDRAEFQRNTTTLLDMNATMENRATAAVGVDAFVRALVQDKRTAPADDLLSALAQDSDMTDEELRGVAFLLFGAGYETTANMLALGMYTLLVHPAEAERLRGDSELVAPAVEELLRYLTVIHIGPCRTALEDVELGGRLIRAGETLTLSLGAANRDPGEYTDPHRFDPGRAMEGHLAFGHGPHFCIGHQLARTEMRIAFPEVLRRFPTLRLAVEPEEIPMREQMAFYGVHKLPVTWNRT
ncbi:cytochrome P450 [Actinoallomurus acanthiterrae]